MKKLLFSIFIALIALPSQAAIRTEAQAAAMAAAYFTSDNPSPQIAKAPAQSVPVRLVRTIDFAQQATPAIYIYEQEQSSRCVFIAASDKINSILGYTDEPLPLYSSTPLPPSLELWLQSYADEIAMLEFGYAILRTVTPGRTPIQPLLKDENKNLIQWNQTDPYNRYCPIQHGGTDRSATGCVATAIAQIMRYYAYPTRPTGKVSYKWEKADQTLSINYDTVPDYKWSLMKNKKSNYKTNEQKNAVAQLMRDVGYSVSMDYGSSSGASTPDCVQALPKYFGYNENIFIIGALALSTKDYEDLVYQSLTDKHPLVLTGTKVGGGAHAFVCDGADDQGFFHINWGWGGSYDGYFDLSILDSKGTGTGGSSAAGGYCVHRSAVFNIQPPTDTKIITKPTKIHPLSADSLTIDVATLKEGQTLTATIHKITNVSGDLWSGNYGFLLCGDNLKARYWRGGKGTITDFKPEYMFKKEAAITYSALTEYCTEPGVYYLEPSYKATTEGAVAKAMPVAIGADKITLTLDSKGTFTVELKTDTTQPTPPEPDFEAVLIDLENDSAAIMWDGPSTIAYCDYTITVTDNSFEQLSGRSYSREDEILFRYYTKSTITLTITAYSADNQKIGTDTDQITPSSVKTSFKAENVKVLKGKDLIRFTWTGEAPYYQATFYQDNTTVIEAQLIAPQQGVFTLEVEASLLPPASYKLGLRPVSPTKKAYLTTETRYTFTIDPPTPTDLLNEIGNQRAIKVMEQGQIYFLGDGHKYTLFGQPIN